MTNLSLCTPSAAASAGGAPTSKSTPTEPLFEEHEVQGFKFGDMLTTVAKEPETKKDETIDDISSDRPGEPSAMICAIPAGIPETMSRFDLSMSVTTSVDNGQGLTCSLPSIAQIDPQRQGDGPITGVDLAPTRNQETTDLPVATVNNPALKPEAGTPKHANSHSRLTENRPMPATDDGRLASGLSMRSSSQQVLSGEQRFQGTAVASAHDDETLAAVARPSTAGSDAWPENISQTNIPSTSTPPFALPIRITELATHFPAMIVRAVNNLATPSGDVANINLAPPPSLAPPEATRLKILTFDLHPAALGPLTVRMRLSGKQVEIAIDVRSEDVRAILTQTRGSMVEALAEHGLTLEAPDIRLTMPPAPSPASAEPGAAMNEQNNHARPDSFGQNQGHAPHDERPAYTRHPSQAEEQSHRSRSGSFDADKPVGVYL